jgi:hypothetical protein
MSWSNKTETNTLALSLSMKHGRNMFQLTKQKPFGRMRQEFDKFGTVECFSLRLADGTELDEPQLFCENNITSTSYV